MSVTPVDGFEATGAAADFDAGTGDGGGGVLAGEETAVAGFFGSTGAGAAAFVVGTFSAVFAGGGVGGASGAADAGTATVTGTAAPTGIHSACHGRMADEFARV